MKILADLPKPLFINHLQIGYKIKLIKNEKLKGMKRDLPKYNMHKTKNVICIYFEKLDR